MSELIQLLFIMLYMFEFIYVYLCKKNVGGKSFNGNCIITEWIPDLLKVISPHIFILILVLWGWMEKPRKNCFSPFKKKQRMNIYVWIKIKDKQFKEPRRRRSFGFGIRIQYFFTKKDLPLWSSNFPTSTLENLFSFNSFIKLNSTLY